MNSWWWVGRLLCDCLWEIWGWVWIVLGRWDLVVWIVWVWGVWVGCSRVLLVVILSSDWLGCWELKFWVKRERERCWRIVLLWWLECCFWLWWWWSVWWRMRRLGLLGCYWEWGFRSCVFVVEWWDCDCCCFVDFLWGVFLLVFWLCWVFIRWVVVLIEWCWCRFSIFVVSCIWVVVVWGLVGWDCWCWVWVLLCLLFVFVVF